MKTQSNDNEIDLLLARMQSAAAPFRDTLRDLHARLAKVDDGKVADYIPELARANPDWFGISAVTTTGQTVDVGDSSQLFTIQSISKPFVYGQVLEDHGLDATLSRVGVEPTGEAFNAILLDEKSNRPFNPMVNAGAIATADLIEGRDFPDRVKRLVNLFSRYCGREVYVDNAVYHSERATGHRNRAIAHLMLNFNMMSERLEDSLDLYFQQCSMLVNCHDLAVMGATLANGGVNPITGERAVSQENVKYILSVMHSCGMYDYAGEWAFRVGIPAKSGVSGGIVAVVPGKLGLGIFSPPLDAKGNSVRGVKVCEELSKDFGLHCFNSGFTGPAIEDQLRRIGAESLADFSESFRNRWNERVARKTRFPIELIERDDDSLNFQILLAFRQLHFGSHWKFRLGIKPDAIRSSRFRSIDLGWSERARVESSKIEFGVQVCRVTISVGGIVAQPSQTEQYDADALVALADEAMYRSKANGRNQVTIRSLLPDEVLQNLIAGLQ